MALIQHKRRLNPTVTLMEVSAPPVSYTHLTLPTIRLV